MDGLTLYITVAAVSFGILSSILNIMGRQKYKDNASFFESANHELREQNTSIRQDKTDLIQQNATLQADSASKERLIKELKDVNLRLPDFTQLTQNSNELMKLMSNNHRETIGKLTELGKVISKHAK